MPKRVVDLRDQKPLLDVASYGRRGPGHRALTKAEAEHVSRTVRRVPEVMIKVSGGARTLRGVRSHLDYLGREGRGEVETDEGVRLQERGCGSGAATSLTTFANWAWKPMPLSGRCAANARRRNLMASTAPSSVACPATLASRLTASPGTCSKEVCALNPLRRSCSRPGGRYKGGGGQSV